MRWNEVLLSLYRFQKQTHVVPLSQTDSPPSRETGTESLLSKFSLELNDIVTHTSSQNIYSSLVSITSISIMPNENNPSGLAPLGSSHPQNMTGNPQQLELKSGPSPQIE